MQEVILIRYGEIFLKGRNKSYFEGALINNIKKALVGVECNFIRTQNRYYIEDYDQAFGGEILGKLKKVFGIHSLSVATKCASDYQSMQNAILAFAPQDETKTFRVTVNRADKRLDKTSTEIAAMLGGYILENRALLSVNLHNPDLEIKVDIREQGYAYIFRDIILGAQGMPVGTAGKGMLLLSGGFDSPVAGWRMARRGMEICAIHYQSYPYTSEQAKQKVLDLAQTLTAYCGKIRVFVVPFTKIQQAIHEKCRADYMITIMRRIMVDIAERVAVANDCGALITGESLGQVASQTMQSITVTNEAVKNLPVFRPLISCDKYEIMDIAKEINTFKLSELPFEDCCTVFLPKNPVIKPSLETAQKEQSHIENIEELIADAIENIEFFQYKPQ
ncbi:MAG: tRNA uracil 4-sulfurtransferase ThiI [Clostridia bacterium]